MRKYLGPTFRSSFEDVKKPLLDSIDKELSIISETTPPAPVKTFRGAEELKSSPGGATVELPREDFSAKITKKVIADLEDSQWKTKLDVLTSLSTALRTECKSLIGPELGNLPLALKSKFSDKTKNVQKAAITLCGEIAVAMGKPFEKHAKVMLPSIIALLGDNNAPTKDSAIEVLKMAATSGVPSPLIASLFAQSLLDNPNSSFRAPAVDFLSWMICGESKIPWSPTPQEVESLKPLVRPMLLCALDKIHETRTKSESIVEQLAKSVGAPFITKTVGAAEFKPAMQQTLQPLLTRIKGGDDVPEVQKSEPQKPAKSKSSGSIPTSTTQIVEVKEKEKEKEKEKVVEEEKSIGLKKYASAVSSEQFNQEKETLPSSSLSTALFDDKKRASREVDSMSLPWIFTSSNPPSELLSSLRSQMSTCVQPELLAKLCNQSISMRFGVSPTLMSKMKELPQVVLPLRDIMLKYSTTLLCTEDPIAVEAGMNVIETIVKIIREKDGLLDDFDIGIVLPFILHHPMKLFPEKVHLILSQLRTLYPASKLFTKIFEHITKSAWAECENELARAECVKELADLIGKQGPGVCPAEKIIPHMIVLAASDSDELKLSALDVLASLYAHLGESITNSMKSADMDPKSIEYVKAGRTHQTSLLSAASAAHGPSTANNVKKESTVVPASVVSKKFDDWSLSVPNWAWLGSDSSSEENNRRLADIEEMEELTSAINSWVSLQIPHQLVAALGNHIFLCVSRGKSFAIERSIAARITIIVDRLISAPSNMMKTVQAEFLEEIIVSLARSIAFLKIEMDEENEDENAEEEVESEENSLTDMLPATYLKILEKSEILNAVSSLLRGIRSLLTQHEGGLPNDVESLDGECVDILLQSLYQLILNLKAQNIPPTQVLGSVLEELHYLLNVLPDPSSKSIDQRQKLIAKTAFTLVHNLVSTFFPPIV